MSHLRPHPPAGSSHYACSADQETQRLSQAALLTRLALLETHTDHLLLSDQVEGRILLSLGVQSAVSFLHPGSVLSMREKQFFYHLSLIHL